MFLTSVIIIIILTAGFNYSTLCMITIDSDVAVELNPAYENPRNNNNNNNHNNNNIIKKN